MTDPEGAARRHRSEPPIGLRRAGAILLGAVLAGSLVQLTIAASPSPSAVPRPEGAGIEFWLDQPLPTDAPPGGTVSIGLTLWDPSRNALADIVGPDARLFPATGKAAPTTTRLEADWPGHVSGTLTVPKGGPGRLDVGFTGRTCGSDGTCSEARFPFVDGGIGPPPDASIADLVTAHVDAGSSEPVVGSPIDIVVEIEPRAEWPPGLVTLPDHLVAAFTNPAGSAAVDLPRSSNGGPYAGQIVLDDAGAYVLNILVPAENGEDRPIGGTTKPINVVASAEVSAAPATIVAAPEPGVAWGLVGAAILAIAAGSLVIRRTFADL